MNAARGIARDLTRTGFQAYFAGGCVRDALLGRPLKDVDIATSASPDQVEKLFEGHTVSVGKAFGVILVQRDGFSFDVATFRTDGPYTDGRHPEGVCFATPEHDAQRRDFTVNGLFRDPESGQVIDFVGGLADLDARVIRAIGDPEARFREDHLRMLRAVRFSAVLGFRLDDGTREAIARHAGWIKRVSAERVATELVRMLCESPRPSAALDLLLETGLLAQVLPEVLALRGVEQPPQYHPEGDVWTHTCLMLDDLPTPRDPDLTLGVLFHDIGKPAAFCVAPDDTTGQLRIRFPCHASIGVRMTKSILTRLKFPTERIETVSALVSEHMHFVDAQNMRRAKLRRFLGGPHFPKMLELVRLDIKHSNGDFSTWDFLKSQYDAFTDEPVLPEPKIRGRDLLALGIPPGPPMGKLLAELYDAQLEGRFDEAWAHFSLAVKTQNAP
ncbi:MAG: CCA tRNA nucleotidyltransferase [Kiritimatiellaeota bacterium]|nr:CCA tRNA nucleotidyltransferase [Kiritimatiellota bacterium]